MNYTRAFRAERQRGQKNEKCYRTGASVTKPTKAHNPSRVGRAKIFETAGERHEAKCPPGPANETGGGPCQKKTTSKSEIADQIGLHLRSVYDDILAQPVPGRFLELLRQLESASEVRTKDGM